MNRGLSIAGRKNFTSSDYYQTPSWATRALLKHETFDGKIWEPASGAGAISRILEAEGYKVISSDIREDDNVYGLRGSDFFEEGRRVDNIVTNPPFNQAKEMIDHALVCAKDKVAFLLKLQFLEGNARSKWFPTTPLKKVWVFPKRITMFPEGEPEPKNSGTIAFAWYIWQQNYNGEPTIGWLT